MRALAVCLTVGLAATPALGAGSVFGSGFARQCFDAAIAGRADAGALGICDKALSDPSLLASDRGATLVNRGVLKLRSRQYVEAMTDLSEGVKLNPEAGDGWLDKGAVELALHHDREGLDDIDHAISLGVREPQKAYYDRAVAEERLNDDLAAYFDYQRAIQIAPDWELPKTELKHFTVTEKPPQG
ncbi:MAG TPA: hypothetical protein VG248_07895 [Caulobacteraceae bacterium]|jgi:tetratricopeptide (TPR) repeat protein|nr:hypothetical protein [Caulobacteraceae bacterium]